MKKNNFGCTTMIVGKTATVDGSVIVAHSDDDVADERVIYVPARTYAEDEQRNVYYDDASLGFNSKYNSTPLRRYIGYDRGPGYEPIDSEGFKESIPLGSIPQYPKDDTEYPMPLPTELKTYAYFDGSYGIMNEHQLMIGECTCGAKVHPEPDPEKRIFYSSELSRIALERCKTARDAIKLMGYLIKKYGYYGTGETLLVGDANEAWVMEMCGYDMDGTDGIWVAKKVPDDEYFVAANEFRIREIIREKDKDSDNMMYSDNLFGVCEKLGWIYKSAPKMDWLVTVSWGEYSHPYYSLRRIWRAMSKVAPSIKLSPWIENGYTKEYPFSSKPDKPLSVADIAAIYRDNYEDTEFDLTQGIAAGPWGDPTRYDLNPDQGNTFNLNTYRPKGAWERPISIYRCGMFWINQAREYLPAIIGGISWIGLDRPAANCLIPFYAGVTNLPAKIQTMNLMKFDRENSAWWAFNFVGNYATIKYSYMIEDIKAKQQDIERKSFNALPDLDKKASDLYEAGNIEDCCKLLTDFCNNRTCEIVADWWKLSESLIVKYNDGCITDEKDIMQHVSYPCDWLLNSGYFRGPVSYKKPE